MNEALINICCGKLWADVVWKRKERREASSFSTQSIS